MPLKIASSALEIDGVTLAPGEGGYDPEMALHPIPWGLRSD
jgi:hypothetical protein